MGRSVMAILAVGLLFPPGPGVAQNSMPREADVEYGRLMLKGHPVGSTIEVTQTQGGRITGKLVAVSEHVFEVETVKRHQVSRQNIAFADVKLINKHGMSKKKKAGIAVAVAAGAAAALIGAMAAAFSGGWR
jgi:hypothetical protein